MSLVAPHGRIDLFRIALQIRKATSGNPDIQAERFPSLHRLSCSTPASSGEKALPAVSAVPVPDIDLDAAFDEMFDE